MQFPCASWAESVARSVALPGSEYWLTAVTLGVESATCAAAAAPFTFSFAVIACCAAAGDPIPADVMKPAHARNAMRSDRRVMLFSRDGLKYAVSCICRDGRSDRSRLRGFLRVGPC